MPNNRRFSEIMLGLFLLFLGASALLEGINFLMIIILMAGIFLLVRQFEGGRLNLRPRSEASARRYVTPPPPSQEVETSDDQRRRIYQHALTAVETAGHDPETVRVLATDIGVMAFKGDQEPVIYRTRDVLDDVDYIQPYVQLRLPTKAVGRIRFEVVDADGETLFSREEHHQLERGRNLITPAARIPVHDAQALDGDWELRVSADDMLLAVHRFGWEESASRVVRRHLSEDGEISSELRAAMAENRLQELSLDELLDYADDEDTTAQQQRKS